MLELLMAKVFWIFPLNKFKKSQAYKFFIKSLKIHFISKAVNYLGPVYLIKTILPKMIQAKIGHIVNIASIAHLIYGINLSDYSASKAALYNFHSGLRLGRFFHINFKLNKFLELKKSGVNIATTVINPHVINTGMFEGMTTRLNLYRINFKEKFKKFKYFKNFSHS